MLHELSNTPCNNECPDESFVSLYRHYRDGIYQQAFQLTSCPHSAEDIAQDVFLSLWKHKHRWGEIENIQAYLFFCTRNKTMDHFQRVRMERTTLQKWSETGPLYDSSVLKVEMREQEKMYEEAILRLPPQQRKVYTLRRLYGWKRKKIAGELQLSDNTVKQHMQFAIRSVKEFMRREMAG